MEEAVFLVTPCPRRGSEKNGKTRTKSKLEQLSGGATKKHNHGVVMGGGATRNRKFKERRGILTGRISQNWGQRPRAEALFFPGN